MKVTALLDDSLVAEIKLLIPRKTFTESLSEALKGWVRQKKIISLYEEIKQSPLEFQPNFSANSVRSLSRKPQ